MTTERARCVARAYKIAADAFQDLDVPHEAARAERYGQWWMTYSRSLATKPPERIIQSMVEPLPSIAL